MSASDPAVTVLTAVRDGSRYLAETLESIRAQTFEDWEYIVVDDASDDQTPEILERYERMDPRIRVLRRTTSGGPYAAANSGLEVARGRHVVRIDADDVAVPRRIELQLAFLARNPGYRACLGSWRWLNDAGEEGEVRRVHTSSPRVLRWSLCVVAGLVHSTACIERAALEEVGGYKEIPTSADLDLWCSLSRRGWLGVMPEVLVAYRRHATQITSVSNDKQREHGGRVLKTHLEALTEEVWDLGDVWALYAPGRWGRVAFDRGSAMIDRWERSWRRDPSLDGADRRELRALTTRVRLRHLRTNGRSLDGVVGSLRSLVAGRSAVRGDAR